MYEMLAIALHNVLEARALSGMTSLVLGHGEF